MAWLILIAGVVPPDDAIGDVPVTDVTVPAAGVVQVNAEPLHVNTVDAVVGADNHLHNREPVTSWAMNRGQAGEGNSFYEMASERGLIFMYELVQDKSEGDIMY